MKIINRIMISSALLVFLSLLSLAGVFVVIIMTIPVHPERDVLDSTVVKAQQTLFTFDGDDWDDLASRLSADGYDLLVLSSDDVVYSKLDASWEKIIKSLAEIERPETFVIGKVDEITFAAVNKTDISLIALRGKLKDEDSILPLLTNALPVAAVVFIFILLLSQLFTRKMAWRILQPLGELADGARRVSCGTLSVPVSCDNKNEFGEVSRSFNNMQASLLSEKEKTASYEKARIDLISGISHDLRTPLTSIRGFVKGLRDGVAVTPEKREQYLSIVYQKACDMDVLLERLFDISRLETGNLPLSLAPQDLGDFARSFTEQTQVELEQTGVVIRTNVTSVPHPITIDAEQMNRVLRNLVENAVRYSGAGQLCITLSVFRESGYERLVFADNGRGVAEENLPRLFERFWREDESRSTKNGEGSGLGLYIVKFIVEAHGGTVSARNNNGLIIEIALPCGKEGPNA